MFAGLKEKFSIIELIKYFSISAKKVVVEQRNKLLSNHDQVGIHCESAPTHQTCTYEHKFGHAYGQTDKAICRGRFAPEKETYSIFKKFFNISFMSSTAYKQLF